MANHHRLRVFFSLRMKPLPFTVALGLLAAACRSDTTSTEKLARAPAPAAASEASALIGTPADTLHLPDGRVVQLRPTTAEAFNRLPGSPLPELFNDPKAERLTTTQGQVRRQGLDLLLHTAQRTDVKLSSTPDAEFTLQNADGVKYMYWGQLSAAHQWAVRAWYWESDGTVLVDQRTGRRLDVLGTPVPSADGRFVVLASPGLSGGDQANALSLVAIEADGPHLLWQREPTTWEPQEVRWANPGIAVLKLRRADATGSVPDDAPASYVELPLPR